ncbi:MAG TPA: hypothetical protein VIK60_07725 [Vicinamibacterales bacterium]
MSTLIASPNPARYARSSKIVDNQRFAMLEQWHSAANVSLPGVRRELKRKSERKDAFNPAFHNRRKAYEVHGRNER